MGKKMKRLSNNSSPSPDSELEGAVACLSLEVTHPSHRGSSLLQRGFPLSSSSSLLPLPLPASLTRPSSCPSLSRSSAVHELSSSRRFLREPGGHRSSARRFPLPPSPSVFPPPLRRLSVPPLAVYLRTPGNMATVVTSTRFTDEYQLYEELGK